MNRLFIYNVMVLLLSSCSSMRDMTSHMNPCIWMCSEQSMIQQEYAKKRDKCQELAELKLPLYVKADSALDEQTKNAQLLALFSECMHDNDWAVTGPKVDAPPAAAPAAAPAAPGAPVPTMAAPPPAAAAPVHGPSGE